MIYFMMIMSICLLFIMLIMINKNFILNKEKLFSFECGFEPFILPRNPFSIQYYKILLIFLLFDLEIIIILPLPLFNSLNLIINLTIFMIILILMLGLYYEWKEGALEWIK